MNSPYASAPPPNNPTAQTRSGVLVFLDSLGEAGRLRPRPILANALVGIGGALVPIALAVLFTGNSDSVSGVYIACLLTFGASFLLRFKTLIPANFMPATTSAAVSSLVLLFIILIGDTEMDPGLGLLIAGAAHIGLWIAPGFKGASLFLGAGTFVIIAGLVTLLSGDGETFSNDLLYDLPIDLQSYLVRAGISYMILGALVIVGVYFLDRYGYHAVGTSLVAPGMLALIIGIFTTVQDMENAGAGILFFLVGVGLCYVGQLGQRRAMMWWGATVTAVGVVAFFLLAIEPDSGSSIGLSLLISAAVLIGGPTLVSKLRAAGADSQPQ